MPVGRVNNFKPFISQGLILLVGNEDKAKFVSMLQDTEVSHFNVKRCSLC